MKNQVNIFLDSGAFSAWSKGVEIDIQEYIKFIKEHKQYLEVYANLDVIGDAEKTLQNQKIMEEAGLNPLPCFHVGEDFKYLRYYVEKYDYIALGGLVGKDHNQKEKASWLDQIFGEVICDAKGFPKIKVHGYGLTSLRFMLRYPWYSVDSTSWVVTGRLGAIYVPQSRSGVWEYLKESWKVDISTRSPSKKQVGTHIENFTSSQRKVILRYIEEKGYKLGKSEFRMEDASYELKENEKWFEKAENGKRKVELIVENGLSNDYKLRDELNVIYFLDLEKNIPSYPRQFRRVNRGGFGL